MEVYGFSITAGQFFVSFILFVVFSAWLYECLKGLYKTFFNK